MTEQLKRQFDLLALRIAMDLTGDNPQVDIQLQCHESGKRKVIAEWGVQVSAIGLPTNLDRSGRFYSGYSFDFPPDILNEVSKAIASSGYQESPLWLHLAKPIGYLNLVPWEQLLQPALGIPMLRLPDFIANPPRESPNKFEVALCGSAPAAKSEFTVTDHLTGIAELLLATVPRSTTVHIFADIELYDELVARIAQRQLSNVIVHDPASSSGLAVPDRQYTLSDPLGRVQNPWLVWMRDALGGRSIDMVQFLTHGYMLRDSGALALAESPLQNRDRKFSRFVDAAELLAFLTQSGAWSAAFSSPEQNYSEMGLRLLADTIAQMRPGPVLHHETRLDPQREALADAYRFLFGRSHAAPPSSPSLFTYCHPSLITHDELTVKSMNFRSRSAPSAPPATAEDPISAAYAGAEFVPSWIGSSQRYIEQRRHDVERILRDDDATTYSSRSERIEHAQVIEDTLQEIEMELVNVLASRNLGGQLMPRTIIAIDPDVPNALTMRLVKATQNIPDAKVHLPFACTPEAMPPWDSPEAVRGHGLTLLKELEKHPAVKQALQFALMTPAGQTSPVYFHLNEEIAEQLCWESLYSDEKSFLGLDARWPIGRIADSVLDRPSPPQEFSPPLKVAAILSALKRQAVEQWRGLRDAVVAVRANGLPVNMLVFVGEEALLAGITGEIEAGLQGVVVVPVPDRTADLERDLKAFGPHILHFFCHGSASHGVPRLEIATILDWMDGKTTGSLKLSIDDLQNMGALNDVWLVVLNCCESGRAEENTHSIAHMLVANVVPAAIGTLEPFDVSDADELCIGFYPLLFDELIGALHSAAGDGWVELEWATALRGARRSLSEKHDNDPSNHREWALPVLYVRPEPWLLKKPSDIAPAAPDLSADTQLWKQKSEVVAGYLKALPPDADMEVRQAIFNVLAAAPDWLKPDLYGNFQGAEVDAAAPVVHEPLLQI